MIRSIIVITLLSYFLFLLVFVIVFFQPRPIAYVIPLLTCLDKRNSEPRGISLGPSALGLVVFFDVLQRKAEETP